MNQIVGNRSRIAIIGGGPIGMEAALYGACSGFDVAVYERGRIAENVRQWGHVRVFTNWGRNRSPLACRLLAETGYQFPPGDATSTGQELAEYVELLAALPQLRGRIHASTSVMGLAREGCLKSDFIGNPRRADFPFRLHLRSPEGDSIVHADHVIDATGVYATPNWCGNGGMPCLGEVENREFIDYHLPDVEGSERDRFANRHTLIIGSGHSAASTLLSISSLMGEAATTRITWAVRRAVPEHGNPYTLVAEDPSSHRNELHRRANELAGDRRVDFRPRTVVDSIRRRAGKFVVTLSTFTDRRAAAAGHDSFVPLPDSALESRGEFFEVECDNVVAHTGFRPDFSLWSEVRVLVHPGTDAPYRLGEAMVAQNRRGGVGLSTGYAEKRPAATTERSVSVESSGSAESLASAAADPWHLALNDPEYHRQNEPNFYIIGIKSYGRDAGFLMHNGFRQVRDVYKLMAGVPEHDLYGDDLR